MANKGRNVSENKALVISRQRDNLLCTDVILIPNDPDSRHKDRIFVSQQVIDAYLCLFNIVNPKQYEITKAQQFLLMVSKLKSLLIVEERVKSNVEQQLLAVLADFEVGNIDITKPGGILSVLHELEQAFAVLLRDPTVSQELQDQIYFFITEGLTINPRKNNFTVSEKIKSQNGKFLTPDRGISYKLIPLTDETQLKEMGGTIQAVLPQPTQIDSLRKHKPSTVFFMELFLQAEQLRKQLEKEERERDLLRDPLLFLPNKMKRKTKESIQKMMGLYVSTLYDLLKPFSIRLGSDDLMTKYTLGFIDVFQTLSKLPASAHFLTKMPGDPYPVALDSFWSGAPYGMIANFGEKQISNDSEIKFFETPHQVMNYFEELLRARFSNNFNELQELVSKVVELVTQDASEELKRTKVVFDEKELLFKVNTIYSSWITMVLCQYQRLVLEKIDNWSDSSVVGIGYTGPQQYNLRSEQVSQRRR